VFHHRPPHRPPPRRRSLRPLLAAAGLLLLLPTGADGAPRLEAEAEGAGLSGGAVHLVVRLDGLPAGEARPVEVRTGGRLLGTFSLGDGEHPLRLKEAGLDPGLHELRVAGAGAARTVEVRVLPGWLSIVPPLVAIALALAFKEVLVSLFLGVFAGALFLTGWDPVAALGRAVDTYVIEALADADHVKIIVFSMLLGGMVGVISKSGGTRGIVERLAPWATSPRRGQLTAWVMGVLIFFDDYANALIVGSTMRPLTDRLRISREKLAYIVDSTAAPVITLVPVSTWIGFEVGLIDDALGQLDVGLDGYTVFLESIPYRFYPILALVLGFTIAASRRDLGPMLRAERRAHEQGKLIADGDTPLADPQSEALEPPEDAPKRAVNAVLPMVAVVGVTLWGLYATGVAALEGDPGAGWAWLREVLSGADAFSALVWAGFAGVTVAILLAVGQRILDLRQAMEATVEGFRAMLLAMVVLVLAWSLGAVCGDLHTADYLLRVTEGVLSPRWLPAIVFALSAAASFATGTSWGTMGILIPLVVPLIHGLATGEGHPPGSSVYGAWMAGTVSSVLAGSVWGDHCSPISDTTILSSTAAGSDHVAHVRTQAPYALALGLLAIALGDIPSAYGVSPWLCLLGAAGVVVGGFWWLGRPSGTDVEPAADEAPDPAGTEG